MRAKKSPIEKLSAEEQIRRRAYERYLEPGNQPGSEISDWLQAEEGIHRVEEQALDEASKASFPASDPPARVRKNLAKAYRHHRMIAIPVE